MGRSAVVLAIVALAGCASRNEMRPPRDVALSTHAESSPASASERPVSLDTRPVQVGTASWYGDAFAGKRTTNGERFDPRLFTAAHRTLPFGTWVEVRRVDNGRVVRVRINDRGPNGRAKDRVIDLSRRAAEDLGLVHDGVTRVELRVVDGPAEN